jgi:AcrR family transcriptional regulator
MGIKQRQERDRQAVSRAILDAARDLFVTEGYQNVSIRKIAERIEYSPASIYSYFPAKDDIFFALAEEGFRLLHQMPEAAATSPLNRLDRVRAICWRLYQFSLDQPQYFALMFLDRSVPRINREHDACRCPRGKANLLAEVRCARRGSFLRVNPRWSSGAHRRAHRVASMRRPTASHREKRRQPARDVLNVSLAGLQAASSFTRTPSVLDDERPGPSSAPIKE